MTARRLISSGSRFEDEIGYSRAVVDGDHVWVSGTTGYDYAAMTIADDVVSQADQASTTWSACCSSCRTAPTGSHAGRW